MPPTSPRIVYYVSGHGFGHARRAAEVARALARLRPDAQLIVRTTAPPRLFHGIANLEIQPPSLPLDPGAAEDDPLRINPLRTLEQASQVFARAPEIVQAEVEYLRDQAASLILCDIPSLAGDIADAAGLPCWAIGNFTWDWIYQPFVEDHRQFRWLHQTIADGYHKMTGLLRLPFAHEMPQFRQVLDMPLIAPPPGRERDEVLSQLNLRSDARPAVLIAMRGGVDDSSMIRAATDAPDYLFISLTPLPPAAPENLHHIPLGPNLDFADLLAISQIVISKLGYGILSDCIAAGASLLYPPRTGFREDEITHHQAPQYLRMRPLPIADFYGGHWLPHLQALRRQPPPAAVMATDGAIACAEHVAGRL